MTTEQRWKIIKAEPDSHVDRVPIGPWPDEDWLPRVFEVHATAEDDALQVALGCTFEGKRVSVERVVISRTDGTSVDARDLARVPLATLLRLGVEQLGTSQNLAHIGRQEKAKPTPEVLELVAASYCWHYATWGKPREAIMNTWGLPSATANYWITKARELHAMPHPHDGRDA